MAVANGDIGYKNQQGKVFCNRSILLSAINLATKEIKGVAEMGKSFGGFTKASSRKDSEGVKVEFLKDGINIDINVKVFSNASVPEVASRIQQNVNNALLSMLDNLVIKSININVSECVLARDF